MFRENFLSDLRTPFVGSRQKVAERFIVSADQAPNILFPWNCYFSGIFRKFDARLSFDLNQLINASQCRLRPACSKISADTIAVDFMSLQIQFPKHGFIDIVRSHDFLCSQIIIRKQSAYLYKESSD